MSTIFENSYRAMVKKINVVVDRIYVGRLLDVVLFIIASDPYNYKRKKSIVWESVPLPIFLSSDGCIYFMQKYIFIEKWWIFFYGK